MFDEFRPHRVATGLVAEAVDQIVVHHRAVELIRRVHHPVRIRRHPEDGKIAVVVALVPRLHRQRILRIARRRGAAPLDRAGRREVGQVRHPRETVRDLRLEDHDVRRHGDIVVHDRAPARRHDDGQVRRERLRRGIEPKIRLTSHRAVRPPRLEGARADARIGAHRNRRAVVERRAGARHAAIGRVADARRRRHHAQSHVQRRALIERPARQRKLHRLRRRGRGVVRRAGRRRREIRLRRAGRRADHAKGNVGALRREKIVFRKNRAARIGERKVVAVRIEAEIRVQHRAGHRPVFAAREHDQIPARLNHHARGKDPLPGQRRVVRQPVAAEIHRHGIGIENLDPVRAAAVFIGEADLVAGEKLGDERRCRRDVCKAQDNSDNERVDGSIGGSHMTFLWRNRRRRSTGDSPRAHATNPNSGIGLPAKGTKGREMKRFRF